MEAEALEKNREELYEFMGKVFELNPAEIKKTVKDHADSHTVEIWKENLGDSFPGV
jgi:hypothetical protein